MPVETQQGKRRARTPRPGETALVVSTVLAGPFKDPTTGRWLPGNKAARLRALKTAGKLTTLNPAVCAPWARPYIELAQKEASELVVEVGAEETPSLMAFAEDAATAVAMHRAFMAIALSPDADEKTKIAALAEARMWLKERRQSLLSLRAEARSKMPERASHVGRDPFHVYDEEPTRPARAKPAADDAEPVHDADRNAAADVDEAPSEGEAT